MLGERWRRIAWKSNPMAGMCCGPLLKTDPFQNLARCDCGGGNSC